MQFEPGKSGNPAGRPRGIVDRRVALRRLLEPHAPELVDKVVEMAKGGDAAALRICLERLIPPMKAGDDHIEMPDLGADPAANATAIVHAIGSGSLTPEQGATMLQAFAAQAKIIEAAEIERRIAALEAAQKRKG